MSLSQGKLPETNSTLPSLTTTVHPHEVQLLQKRGRGRPRKILAPPQQIEVVDLASPSPPPPPIARRTRPRKSPVLEIPTAGKNSEPKPPSASEVAGSSTSTIAAKSSARKAIVRNGAKQLIVPAKIDAAVASASTSVGNRLATASASSSTSNSAARVSKKLKVEKAAGQKQVPSLSSAATMPSPPLEKVGSQVVGSNHGELLRLDPSTNTKYSGNIDNNNIASRFPPSTATKQAKRNLPNLNSTLETVTEALEIMLTFENCSCSFCTENLAVGEGIMLQDCCCCFCRTCLVTVVENATSAEVLCLNNSRCGGRLFPREIKALVPLETYKKYTQRTEVSVMAMMPNMFHCKTKGCNGCCEYQLDSKVFLCVVCNKSNCLSCKAIHEGLECKDFQALLSTATKAGKSWEEAEEFINSHQANGWEQFLGTVSGWMDNSPSARKSHSQNYSKILQKMANQDLWLSTREFECPICISTIPVGEGIILQDCLHTLCRECASGLVEHATEPEVKCPYREGNYSCAYHLNPREIKALVSPKLHEAFLARSVKQAESVIPNSFHCKTPDCQGWCIFDADVDVFTCEICTKKNCITCAVIHENVSCEDYKNRLVQDENDIISKNMLEGLIAEGKCMRCPTCKIVAEKTIGCDWIVCAVCKTEICWATKGPRWGPKGQGDVTGGCKCKIGGKLCVPNCMNCH